MRSHGVLRALAAVSCLFLGGCSVGQMVARSSVEIMDGAARSMNRETDYELARAAIPANLKMLEGLIEEAPDDASLKLYAAEGFYGYAWGFVEDEHPGRALGLYRRCAAYSAGALSGFGFGPDWTALPARDLDERLAKLGRDAVPGLFWAASCVAKVADVDRSDPANLARIGAAEAAMRRVLDLDPSFYHHGPHIFFGIYYGALAPSLGGDPARADRHLAIAREGTEGRLLALDVLEAQYIARQRQDRAAFRKSIDRVLDAPEDRGSDLALANAIARHKAEWLLTQEDEWF